MLSVVFFCEDFVHNILVFKKRIQGRFENVHLSYANRLFCNYISSVPYISVSNIGALQVKSLQLLSNHDDDHLSALQLIKVKQIDVIMEGSYR